MYNFSVGIKNGFVVSNLDDIVEEHDIISMLEIREDEIEESLKTHAANQAYWEALAVRLKNKMELFEEEWSMKWWSHHKNVAKDILCAMGENKPTVDSLKSQVVMTFSGSFSQEERERQISSAYNFIFTKDKRMTKPKEEYMASAMKFLAMDPPWYFETIVNMSNKLKSDYEIVNVVAKRLDSRSFHLESLVKLIMAKKWNIGPVSFSEKELMEKARKR